MNKNVTKFEVWSRYKAETFKNDLSTPHAFISVYTPQDEPPLLSTNENTLGILSLSFDDMDTVDNGFEQQFGRKQVLFDEYMALSILYFFEKVRGNLIIVHCDAGVSRSPAIAAALSVCSGQSDSMFFNRFCPNRLVYKKILEENFKRREVE